MDGRRFGVEIECTLPGGVHLAEVEYAIALEMSCGWTVRGDRTVGRGLEVVSPPMTERYGHAQIGTVCSALRRIGCTAGKKCGLHVHHDLAGEKITAVRNFVRAWAAHQDLIDALVAPHRRDGASKHCTRLSHYELVALDGVTEMGQIGTVATDRYRTVNLHAYPLHGTVEIRQHHGTVEAHEISAWVRLGQAMLDDAGRRRKPRPPADSVQGMLEDLQGLDASTRTFLIGRAVELGHDVQVGKTS